MLQNVDPVRHRIDIPLKYRTPFPNVVFDRWFATLKERHAAAVYAVLHDRAYHSPDRGVKASYSAISEWTSLDWRVVKACIKELRRLGLVHKSRSRKWEVPLAKLNELEGKYTPIPRVLIQKYIPAYHNSALLLVLLKFQNINWLDYCWPGTKTLASKLNWSETRVRDAIGEMSDVKKWKRRGTELPHPLSGTYRQENGRWLNHYRVRAVRYEARDEIRTVRFSSRFGKAFDLPVPSR